MEMEQLNSNLSSVSQLVVLQVTFFFLNTISNTCPSLYILIWDIQVIFMESAENAVWNLGKNYYKKPEIKGHDEG